MLFDGSIDSVLLTNSTMSNTKDSPSKTKRKSGAVFVKSVLPSHENSINDVFVNNKTKLNSAFAICRKLLDQKTDYLVLHGMGKSISKTIRLANLLKETMKSSITVNVRTGTVMAKDTIYSKFEDESGDTSRNVNERPVPTINIRVARVFM